MLCPVNPSTKTARLAYIIGNCRAAATITQGRLAGVVTSALETTSTVQQVILTDANPALPQAAIFGDCLSVESTRSFSISERSSGSGWLSSPNRKFSTMKLRISILMSSAMPVRPVGVSFVICLCRKCRLPELCRQDSDEGRIVAETA